jgi:hypothetical protein
VKFGPFATDENGSRTDAWNSIRIHPRLSVSCFHALRPGDLLEIPRNIRGMVVAQGTAIALTDETWAWSTKGGRRNALDDFCNSFGPVVTRRGK